MAQLSRREFTKQTGKAALALPISSQIIGAIQTQAAPAKRKIKIAQIGTGHAHAPGKMATMRKFSDDYEVVGVAESDPQLRKAMRERDVYKDIAVLSEDEILNTPGLEAVAVETTVRNLVPTAQRCIDTGLHIHLDKPAGESLDSFKKLLDTATEKKLVVQMGYMYRYHPAFQLCHRAIQEGWLGDIFELHGVLSKGIGPDKRKAMAGYAGGSMFELGCHLIDLLVWMLGKPDRITAYTRKTRPQQDSLADNQLAVFEYTHATATIRSTLVEYRGEKRRQFVVCGDKGTVDIRPIEPAEMLLALSKPVERYVKGYQTVELPPVTGRYDADFMDLAKIVREEKAPGFTPEHDLAVHEAILRASDLPLT